MLRLILSQTHCLRPKVSLPKIYNCSCIRMQSTEMKIDEKGKDIPPPKYLGSAAANWKGEHTRRGTDAEMLWYQPYVVCASTAVFLIYFCILREENDIDELIYKPLYESIPDIEKTDLLNYRKSLKPGDPNIAKVDARLDELRELDKIRQEQVKAALKA